MAHKLSDQVNAHGRRLIDNKERDYAPYLVKRIKPTMRAFTEFLTEQFGDLSELPPERLLYLAISLHDDFQGGTWWDERKYDYRPGSGFNNGDKPGPKPGNATPGPVARHPDKPSPKRSRRERDTDLASPY
jgi:hypothetical protein